MENLNINDIINKAKKAQVVKKAVSAYYSMCASLDSIRDRDPAAKNRLEVLALYPGIHAVMAYRITHFLHINGFKTTARAISQLSRAATGIEIHPGAKIGKRLFIDHGMGVVIGETTVIGDDCTLYQGVTLGGTGKDTGKRHPTLGNNVMVGAGAKVLGPLTIGNNVKIASNAVVLDDIPDNSTAVGVPARVVRRAGERVSYDLDQVHIMDPLSQEICKLNFRIDRLQKELDSIGGGKNGKSEKSGKTEKTLDRVDNQNGEDKVGNKPEQKSKPKPKREI